MRFATPSTWLPLSAQRHPLPIEQSWSAIQMPVHVIGSVWRKVESWCAETSPPMRGFLKMNMLCTGVGLSMPSDLRVLPTFSDLENARKGWVEVVHGVADLVDGARLGLPELAGRLVEGVLLEEEGEMVAAVEEVGVARALLVLGGEDGSGHGGRVEGIHELVRARQHALDLLRGGEVGEDEEAVFAELLNLLGGERPVEGDAHGDARLLGSQCLEES